MQWSYYFSSKQFEPCKLFTRIVEALYLSDVKTLFNLKVNQQKPRKLTLTYTLWFCFPGVKKKQTIVDG